MIVRDIPEVEIESVLKFGCSYSENQTVAGGLDAGYYVRKFKELYRKGVAHIFGMFSDAGKLAGALGFFVVPNLFNREIHAIQNFWYVAPEFRGRGLLLLKEYERQARKLGCTRMQMPHQLKRQPENFGKFFERYGFEAQEVSYYKTL